MLVNGFLGYAAQLYSIYWSVTLNHSSPSSNCTVLFCAESGHFEAQTVLAIECLRTFGGRLANAPILVVTPRFGPSLSMATLGRLADLGAKYLYANQHNSCSWYVYMNKALAANVADNIAGTDQVIWLDSDLLVIDEAEELVLGSDEDFACCALDKNVGSTGPDDVNDEYWRALAAKFGQPIELLPWVTTSLDQQAVRFRLHSGVYSYRTGKGLGQAFVDDLQLMLRSKVGFSRQLPFPGDDVALAFSVARLNLKWRQLPASCNFEMTPSSTWYRRSDLHTAKILHFHKALSSNSGADWFLKELELVRPDVAEWLKRRIPLPTKLGGVSRSAARRFLRELRSLRQRQVEQACDFPIETSNRSKNP